jgi:prophage maintenance system killer protein
MAQLHYLTVQDVLWINLQATKNVQPFSHARLEEATFYQYAYGDSKELVGQAARFLSGFVRMRPLASGVEATTLIAALAFLRINGVRLRLSDAEAVAWFRKAIASTEAAQASLAGLVETGEHGHGDHHRPDVRAAVRAVMGEYPEAIAALTNVPATA